MVAEKKGHPRFKVKPLRRLLQLGVLALLVIVPLYSQNPMEWSPSRIVQGQLPLPSVSPVTGDTWSFGFRDFRLTHPAAFIETVLSAKVIYLPLLLSALIPLAMTLILGRFFCSWLCPVGFLLELNMAASNFFKKIGLHRAIKIKDFRYIILALFLFVAFFTAFPVLSVFDPPHILGRELMYIITHRAMSISGLSILLGILLLELFISSRACCNSLCPSGGCLSLLGRKRMWRIHMEPDQCIKCNKCDEACPYFLNPMGLAEQEKFNWTKCDNCGRCRDSCPTGAITYNSALSDEEEIWQSQAH